MFVVHDKRTNHWTVSSIKLDHNHELVTPTKIHYIRSHKKKVTPVARELISVMDKSGIKPSQMMSFLTSQAGGVANAPYSQSDVYNELQRLRRETFEVSDAQGLLKYCKKMQAESSNFYYNIQVDEENHISAFFWVDARSRLAYQSFGDVVTFDTTYRTNKYGMPFAPFTGVNNHYQSILFGFALLRDEREESFVWLFDTWLSAMNNKAPTTIITDEDIAMSNAIARVFPNTHHALCTWHISQKFGDHLHHVYESHPDFKAQFNKAIYKSLTIEQFEEQWETLMQKYSLRDHSWLKGKYELREKWIAAYSKRFFAAGQTTTSRSEGRNAFFDKYVNATTGITEFVQKTQLALETQYEKEKKQEYETFYKERSFILNTAIEHHAAKIYTKSIFYRFQKEAQKSLHYICPKLRGLSNPDIKVYQLLNVAPNPLKKVPKENMVTHYISSGKIACTCMLFEHSGMLCRHLIHYLMKKDCTHIPSELIASRWTKDASKRIGQIHNVRRYDIDYSQSETLRYNQLCSMFNDLSADGARTMKGYEYLLEVIPKHKAILTEFEPEEDNIRVNMSEDEDELNMIKDHDGSSTAAAKHDGSSSAADKRPASSSAAGSNTPLLDPIMSQTKGRNKATRIKSSIEERCSKKMRKCAICKKMTNHDKRNHYKALGLPEPSTPCNEDDIIVDL